MSHNRSLEVHWPGGRLLPGPKGERKLFHLRECTFRLLSLETRELLNLSPHSWKPSTTLTRNRRARKRRTALGSARVLGNGAEGISSAIVVNRGSSRRVASKAPPPLTFRAVANSRNSFPSESLPRTNTGIARGMRSFVLRSTNALRGAIALLGVANRGPHSKCQTKVLELSIKRRSTTY